jgi:16S rRNA (adenine1518-N6/adenine1519-N6)-dimethyltransferase
MIKGLDIEIKLHRREGQHILIDEDVINRQIEYAGVTGKDTVLEIGPGLGALTLKLANRVGKVVAIEKDTRLFSHLKRKIPQNVELIKGDVLIFELPDFDVVVSNLPYQISSPVTFKLLQHKFRKAILMYQREFAQRMTAEPGGKEYSRLSVNVYYRAKCRILEYVPRNAFHPVPKVDSAIVELVPRKPPFNIIDEAIFFEVVETLFAQRRKKIKNSLSSYITNALRKNGTYSKTVLTEIIHGLPFKNERVEKLSPESIGVLADNIRLSVHEK